MCAKLLLGLLFLFIFIFVIFVIFILLLLLLAPTVGYSGVSIAITRLCDSVCDSVTFCLYVCLSVRKIKPKRLKLNSSNLIWHSDPSRYLATSPTN